MKKVLLLIALWFVFFAGNSQTPVKVEDKIFNFGVKVGLNSTMPIVNSIRINDIEAENISYKYKVGVLAAAFFRINIDRFFLQPSLAFSRTTGDIYYQLPIIVESTVTNFADCEMTYKVTSFEVPALVGYKIVKEDIYGLSLMAGPSFKYSYKIHYSANFADISRKYKSDDTPWGIGIVGGVGVSIRRLFFDVTYEFGLNKTDSKFKEISSAETAQGSIVIDKRANMLSFSLGLLF